MTFYESGDLNRSVKSYLLHCECLKQLTSTLRSRFVNYVKIKRLRDEIESDRIAILSVVERLT